jgi:hypothetical protein
MRHDPKSDRRPAAVTPLKDEDLRDVAGGVITLRKSGKGQQEYLKVTMEEARVGSF